VLLSDPVSNLAGTPDARAFGDFGAGSLKHGRRHVRGVTTTRFVGEGIKAACEEGFDPGADGLLVQTQVASNGGNTLAGVGEAHHFETVAEGRGNPSLARALSQVLALVVSQCYSVHGQKHTKSYELWPGGYLEPIRITRQHEG
jgi:hypothetical protein